MASSRVRGQTTKAPAGGNPRLAAAADRLGTQAYVAALDDLIAAWTACKAAEIADLIDELGAYIATALPAIPTKKTVIDSAWRDVGDLLCPADVPRLIAAFEHGSSAQVEGWLDILDRFPLDPRLCPAAIDTCTRFVASSAGRTRTRAFRLAEKIADGRCIPQIEKLAKRRTDAWNWTELVERVRKMRTKFEPPPALPKDDRAIVAALGKALAKLAKQPAPDAKSLAKTVAKGGDDDGSRLLAAVLADPATEANLLVYADWLQQREDPRGELIALQMIAKPTPGQQDRIAKLVGTRANLTKWLGPLAAVVKEPVFERGFLTGGTIELKTNKHRGELLRHPLWATVRHVRCTERVVVESLPNLRGVSGLSIDELLELSRGRPLPTETIDDVVLDLAETGAREQWDELGRVGAFTKLRSLGIAVHWQTTEQYGIVRESWQWLLGSKLGKQLERFQIDFTSENPPATDWVGALSSTLKTVVIGRSRYRGGVTMEVALERARAVTIAFGDPFAPPTSSRINAGIDDLPTTMFTGFSGSELRVALVTRATKNQRAALEQWITAKLAAQFERVTVTA